MILRRNTKQFLKYFISSQQIKFRLLNKFLFFKQEGYLVAHELVYQKYMQQIENQSLIEETFEHMFKVSPHSPQTQVQSQSQQVAKKSINRLMVVDNLSNKKLGKPQGQNVNKNQILLMSRQEYEAKCIEIKKRIIFGNVPNSRNNYTNAKQNSSDQFSRQKKKKESKNMIYLLNKNGDVKVDFISPQSVAPSQFPNKIKNYPYKVQQKDKDYYDGDKSTSRQFKLKNKHVKSQRDQNQSNKVCIQQLKQKNILKVSSFRKFLYMQLLPNYQIFVQVKCTKKGILNSTYKFYFQQNKKFIMACEKQGFTKYVFSSSQSRIDQSHISHLGSIDTNFAGSQFLIYDSGEDNGKTTCKQSSKKQLAYVHYFQEQNQPIMLSTLITTGDNQSTDFTVSDKKDNILSNQWGMGHREGMSKLTSKLATDDSSDFSDKIDFRGLSGVASAKNVIVQNPNYPQALIFGRQNKETYLMRIKAPFSLMQAFAICMSSIHYKFV